MIKKNNYFHEILRLINYTAKIFESSQEESTI